MDFDLTDEQRLLQETVRAFVDDRVLPVAVENDIEHQLDLDLIQGMAELGILGIVIPEEYGGAGLDFVAEALACEEIERGEAAFRTLISVHVGLNSLSLLRTATEEQKQRWLVPQAKGEKLACFGLTEPGAGSDVAAMRTTARREGDVYVLNGQKNWISYASVADHALVFAKTDPEAAHKGITAFVLEKGMPGFTSRDTGGQARHLGRLDRRALLRERRGAGREPDRRGGAGVRDRDALARPRPVHGRGRRLRRRARLPRAVDRVRTRARDVRAGDRPLPVRPGHDRDDGARLRDVEAARDAGRVDEERGPALDPRDLAREVARDRVGVRGGAPRDPGLRLVRLQRRVRDRAVLPQRAGADHLRGHDADPQADAGRARARLPAAERPDGEVSPICSWAPALSPVHARA